jgi:uncharacterized membrane protein
MFGLSATITLGLGLFLLGLIFLGVQAIVNSRKTKPQDYDPVGGLEKLLKLIKKYGLGMVIVAVGLLIMLLGVVQESGGGKGESPKPSSTSSSATP